MTLHLIPDVEQMVSGYLRAHADVAALVGESVFTALPSRGLTFPAVVVHRLGGEPVARGWVHAVEVQVDAWAETKKAAWLIAATVQAALGEMESRPDLWPLDVGVPTAVDVLRDLQWVPDDTYERPKPRYTADYRLTVHPVSVLTGS